MRVKPFVSWVLGISFVLLIGSGVVLYGSPVGRIAHWNRWTLLGMSKETWQAVHTNLAVLFLATGLWHLVLNWSMLWGYARQASRSGRYLLGPVPVAVLLTGLFLAGTILHWPPWSLLQRGNDQMKAYWEHQLPHPPSPHAEDWTLQVVAYRLEITPEELTQALDEEGFGKQPVEATLAQIASQTGRSPHQVFEAIRKRFPQADDQLRERQKGNGKGQGKRKRP